MSIYPCEARKYLGIGEATAYSEDGHALKPEPCCTSPIQWRMTFYAPDPDAPKGESRVAVAYFCTDHRDAVVALMAVSGDTLADHLSGVDVRKYTPKVADRVANTPADVRRSLAATRAAIQAGTL